MKVTEIMLELYLNGDFGWWAVTDWHCFLCLCCMFTFTSWFIV